ncbi:MAG: hypothetical protein OXE17_03020 [Chloroflexi bacterium]|nr:hypothetical protein [Chloroflexota bacterium]
MPEDTLGNVLSQLQQMLHELYYTGRTTLTHKEVRILTKQVEGIQSDEGRRINHRHKPPRVVKWDDDYFDDIVNEERAPE